MKLTIGQKIVLGYGLAMLSITVTAVAAYRSTQRLLEANDWVQHTFLVIAHAETIGTVLLGIVSACRGYAFTGDPLFLSSIAGSRARLAESRKMVRSLTVDNPNEQHRLDILDPSIDRRLADLMKIANTPAEKHMLGGSVVQQAGEREKTTQIRELLAAMEDEERSLLSRRKQIAEQGAQTTNEIILFGNLVGFAFAGFMGFATYRSISRHLSEFQQFVTSVGEGDLTQESAREGNDELGKLAHGLNEMVELG